MPQDLRSQRHANGSAGLLPHEPSAVKGFSQRLREFTAADDALMQPQTLEPGDLIAHHGLTIHRADKNDSEHSSRRAIGFVYKGSSCSVNEAAHDSYLESYRRQSAELPQLPS